MRNWIILLAFSAISIVSFAQQREYSYGNPMIPMYYNFNMNQPKDDVRDITFLRMDNKSIKEFTCDGKPCKAGIFKKIEFTGTSGTKYYTQGELKHEKIEKIAGGKKFMFTGKMQIYYAENGNLAYAGDYTNFGSLIEEKGEHIFYRKDGSKLYEYLNFEENGRKIHRKITYNENGTMLSDMEYNSDHEYVESKKYATLGTMQNGNYTYPFHFKPLENNSLTKEESWPFPQQIAIDSYLPSVIDHGELGSYIGYSHLGVYNVPDGNNIAGFLLPTVEEYGNGSVVYVTNENKGESYFTIYFDGKLDLDFKVAAEKMIPLEFVRKVNENTDYEHFHAITKKYPTIINIETKNLKTHTGYGINYNTEVPADPNIKFKRTMEIGFFKEGKLDGLGYRLKMQTISPAYYEVGYQGYNVDYEYGFFENGRLLKGKTHKGGGHIMTDIWHPVRIEGINTAIRIPYQEIYPTSDKTVAYSDLSISKPSMVFLASVNKWANVLEIDKTNKTLKVQTLENEIATVGINDGIYLSTITSDAYIEKTCKSCRGTKRIMFTANITEYVYKSRTIRGPYYIDIYYYSYPVTKKKTITRTCGACDGTGRRVYENLDFKYLFTPITFK